MFFLTDFTFFYIIESTERGFVFGTFGLGWKTQERYVVCNVFWLAAAVVGNIEFQMDFSSSKSLWIG